MRKKLRRETDREVRYHIYWNKSSRFLWRYNTEVDIEGWVGEQQMEPEDQEGIF